MFNQIETESEINQNKIDSMVNRKVFVFRLLQKKSFGKEKLLQLTEIKRVTLGMERNVLKKDVLSQSKI